MKKERLPRKLKKELNRLYLKWNDEIVVGPYAHFNKNTHRLVNLIYKRRKKTYCFRIYNYFF